MVNWVLWHSLISEQNVNSAGKNEENQPLVKIFLKLALQIIQTSSLITGNIH